MKVKVYNQQGTETGSLELPASVFGVAVKSEVVHQVVTALRANLRQPLAHTKTRGEVRGGGKKPWKQKGTGRARQGSIRSPQWKGGGVVFGPRNDRNYTQKINKKVKNLALRMVLSDKAAAEKVKVLEELAVPENKTKRLAEILKALALRKVLIVTESKNEQIKRVARNLPNVEVAAADNLNVLELLAKTDLLLTTKAVEKISAIYGQKEVEK